MRVSLNILSKQLDRHLKNAHANPKGDADFLRLSAEQCAEAYRTEEHELFLKSIHNFNDDDETCAREYLKQRKLRGQAQEVLKKIGIGLECLYKIDPDLAMETFDQIKSNEGLKQYKFGLKVIF